ncbi:MAG: hypothetical protein NWE93_12395 [Candidatus Bathyarchaeota archaeon]|nr:hypothetical protein [Candidatus Bathyarchaeota archaeon]
MSTQLKRLHSSLEAFVKVWLVSLVFFVILANTPSLFLDGSIWMTNTFAAALTAGGLLGLGLIALGKYEKGNLNPPDQPVADFSSGTQNTQKISRLHFGILGGLLGVCASGAIMNLAAPAVGECPLCLLAVCGILGGLGFGLPTRGNWKLRGVIGCVFALTAVLFGLLFSYIAPVIVGYRLGLDGEALSPIYVFNTTTFSEYLAGTLFTLNGLFFMYIGLLAAVGSAEIPFRGNNQEIIISQGSTQKL